MIKGIQLGFFFKTPYLFCDCCDHKIMTGIVKDIIQDHIRKGAKPHYDLRVICDDCYDGQQRKTNSYSGLYPLNKCAVCNTTVDFQINKVVCKACFDEKFAYRDFAKELKEKILNSHTYLHLSKSILICRDCRLIWLKDEKKLIDPASLRTINEVAMPTCTGEKYKLSSLECDHKYKLVYDNRKEEMDCHAPQFSEFNSVASDSIEIMVHDQAARIFEMNRADVIWRSIGGCAYYFCSICGELDYKLPEWADNLRCYYPPHINDETESKLELAKMEIQALQDRLKTRDL